MAELGTIHVRVTGIPALKQFFIEIGGIAADMISAGDPFADQIVEAITKLERDVAEADAAVNEEAS